MFICFALLFSVSICDLLRGTLDDRLGFITFLTSLFCCLSVSTDLFSCDKAGNIYISIYMLQANCVVRHFAKSLIHLGILQNT